MSLKPSSSFSQPLSSSSGSTDSPLNLGKRKWLRLLFVVSGSYLILLTFWWYSLDLLSAILAAGAEPLYRLFDPSVSIRSAGKTIDFFVTMTGRGEVGPQTLTSA